MTGVLATFGPAVVFVLGSAAADMVAATGHDPLGLSQLLPFPAPAGSWPAIEAVSTGLFLIGLGLARAKAAVWWAAVLVIVAGGLSQAQSGHAAGAIAAVALGGFLVLTQARHDVPVGRRPLALAIALLAIGLLALRASLLLGAIAVDLGLIVLLGLGHDPRPAADVLAARGALADLGRGALRPYQLGPEAIPVSNLAGTAAFAYARVGRQAVVLGDPSGVAAVAEQAFEAWSEDARQRDWQPVLYQASEGWTRRLEARGWHAIRVGEEAVVDPSTFDLRSPRLANLRHTVTRARKGGIAVTCSTTGIAGLPSGASMAALLEVDAEWLRTAGPSLGFTVGRFDPTDLAGSLVAVAVDQAAQVQAFVVLRPTGDLGWMVDVMRRRRSGPPGSLEACLVEAIERIRSAGSTRLSLGLVPLAGLDPAEGAFEQRALAVASRVIRPVYDVAGLRFFKAKFSPRWESRYLVVRHRWGYGGAAVGLLRLHLGGSWPRVVASLLGRPAADRSRPTSGLARRTAGSS